MRIALTHNKILAGVASERFLKSVEEDLIPLLEQRFENITAVMMYEDYLSCDLRADGAWFYPFTVVTDDTPATVWVKWNVNDKNLFRDKIPYAYIGDAPIAFSIAEEERTIKKMKGKIAGKAIYCEEGLLNLNISGPEKDPLFLAGKYSQTFIDEIDRRMTEEISRACSVRGLADSGISLVLPFAANTFMEHTVENVTYRRFLLDAKGCAPRDFWVKWTRKNASSAFSLADDVPSDEVDLDLGEDVPQKIRETEFRYLAKTDPAKYSSSTGKKNVTEWRDLIRRALKRGNLQKTEEAAIFKEASAHESELNQALNDLLKNYTPDGKPAETVEEPVASSLTESNVQETLDCEKEEQPKEASYVPEKLGDETRFVHPVKADNRKIKPSKVIADTASQIAEIARKMECEEREKQEEEERIRLEIEDQLRAEYENKLRAATEEEAQKRIRERELLMKENERLQEEARIANERRDAEKERSRLEAEERAKADARERERLAEAARLAIAERDRLARLKAEEDRIRAEAQRIERERREAEERALREEEERKRESERIVAERENRKVRAEEERARAERDARRRAGFAEKAASEVNVVAVPPSAEAPKQKVPEEKVNYTYCSHVVHLYFRHPVDAQITAKIRDIIGKTLEFFHKENVFMKIQATVQDLQTVVLNFRKFPEQESELLVNIIKVLGNSKLGVAKITMD